MANQYKLSLWYPMQVVRKAQKIGPVADSYMACPKCKSTRTKVNQSGVQCLACKHSAPKVNFTVYPQR